MLAVEADKRRGERIEDRMRALGYWDTALGEELGVRRETVWRWRQGGTIDPRNVGRLAALLGWTREELMGPGADAGEDPTREEIDEGLELDEDDELGGTGP